MSIALIADIHSILRRGSCSW